MLNGNKWLGLLAAAGLLAGCGSVNDGEDPGVPLAELHGTVSGTTSKPLTAPHVALLWDTPTPLASARTVAAIENQFPTGYTLKLYQPAPDPALEAVGLDDQNELVSGKTVTQPLMKMAFATVLAFDDANGNGDFDVVDADGKPTSNWFDGDTFAPDLLIGWLHHAMELYVTELSQPVDPRLGQFFANPEALTNGFQQIQLCYSAAATAPRQNNTLLQVVPSSTPFDLTLSGPSETLVPESEPFMDVDPTTLPPCTP